MTSSARAPRVRTAGQTNHGRFRREELERKVACAIGQGTNLIRNPLHRGRWGGGQERVAVAWRSVMEKLQQSEGQSRKVRVGLVDRPGSLFSIELPAPTCSVVAKTGTKHAFVIT